MPHDIIFAPQATLLRWSKQATANHIGTASTLYAPCILTFLPSRHNHPQRQRWRHISNQVL